ncbi:MAG: hypothetical protein JNM00_16655, partial [Flavobacteriales bacterium]|nr:hypothetical protein [Flavobacteriales bacterium]
MNTKNILTTLKGTLSIIVLFFLLSPAAAQDCTSNIHIRNTSPGTYDFYGHPVNPWSAEDLDSAHVNFGDGYSVSLLSDSYEYVFASHAYAASGIYACSAVFYYSSGCVEFRQFDLHYDQCDAGDMPIVASLTPNGDGIENMVYLQFDYSDDPNFSYSIVLSESGLNQEGIICVEANACIDMIWEGITTSDQLHFENGVYTATDENTNLGSGVLCTDVCPVEIVATPIGGGVFELSAGDMPCDEVIWTINGEEQDAFGTTEIFDLGSNGVVEVCATPACSECNGSACTALVIEDGALGVADQSDGALVSLYPNPVSDQLTLQFSAPVNRIE